MTKARRKKSRRKIKTKKRNTRSTQRTSANVVSYTLNPEFQFIGELKELILKSSPAEKDDITSKLNKMGRIKLAIIAGVFLNKEHQESMPTDLLVVSDDLDRRKLNNLLKYLEAEVGGEVRFAVMEKDEFAYRLSMFDRFIRVILEGPHEKLINKLGI